MVAFSSAGFFSSITPSGRPLTKITTSGRRLCCPSTTVNWLTASQSFASGVVEVDQPRLVARDGAVGAPVLHVHAVDQHPVERAVVGDHSGCSARSTFRTASSCASAGIPGFRSQTAARRRPSQHHLLVAGTFRKHLAGGDVGAGGNGVARASRTTPGRPIRALDSAIIRRPRPPSRRRGCGLRRRGVWGGGCRGSRRACETHMRLLEPVYRSESIMPPIGSEMSLRRQVVRRGFLVQLR